MIPAAIDIDQILADLSDAGWLDYKIELACGFSRGYIAQVKRREDPKMLYQHAARLYNFWLAECPKATVPVVYVRAQS